MFVVHVKGPQGALNAKEVQQFPGCPSVFCINAVSLSQCLLAANGDVAKVANRGRYQ